MNKKSPTISVLLCVRNGEAFIRETIKSILIQTHIDFEFIIVVNCSTDRTLEVINEFADPRIKVVETVIGQLSFNLNYALNLSTGKYIARIDADDIALPDRFKKQLEVFETRNVDVVGSTLDLIDVDGLVIGKVEYPQRNKEIRKKILYRSVLSHPSIMMRREVLLSVSGYLGGQYAQDYDLWLRLMRDKRLSFYNIQEPLLKYRIHSQQSKGNRNSYAEVAGYFLKESIYSRRPIYILSAFLYYFKAFFLGKRR